MLISDLTRTFTKNIRKISTCNSTLLWEQVVAKPIRKELLKNLPGWQQHPIEFTGTNGYSAFSTGPRAYFTKGGDHFYLLVAPIRIGTLDLSYWADIQVSFHVGGGHQLHISESTSVKDLVGMILGTLFKGKVLC